MYACARRRSYGMLVRTATALLEGGNIDVQRAFMRLLSHRTEPFLRGVAGRIERAAGILRVLPPEVERASPRTARRNSAPRGSGAGAPPLSRSDSYVIAAGAASGGGGGDGGGGDGDAHVIGAGHEAQNLIVLACAIFKLLQRMTEGHYAPMQVRPHRAGAAAPRAGRTCTLGVLAAAGVGPTNTPPSPVPSARAELPPEPARHSVDRHRRRMRRLPVRARARAAPHDHGRHAAGDGHRVCV